MFRSKAVPGAGLRDGVMKLLIAGGGTGGHVFPALAIAREWISRGSERDVVLVGTQRGIEMKLVPAGRFATGNDSGSGAERQRRSHADQEFGHVG